jgi:predicted Zn-dependent peptidase
VISFSRFVLPNGLRVIHHYDPDSSVVVLNTLFNVGARDESPDKTGFAHLFEHLMFGGSKNVVSYDKAVENAGGSNNAFTNNEYTNYYITVPAENAETAFWLESDRMFQLNINPQTLEVQRGVVVEEFKQRCHNAPFGMLWHHLRGLLYQKSPYRWPTIGEDIAHIENAVLDDVSAFYKKHYHPANAILCVAGQISEEETRILCEKWYADITPTGVVNSNLYELDPLPDTRNFMETEDLSPNPAVFMVWRGPVFQNPESAALELFADLLGGSEISPVYTRWVKDNPVFNDAAAFYIRSNGEGLFVLYGVLNEGENLAKGEDLLLQTLNDAIAGNYFTERHMERVKNKATSALLFEKASLINRAQKLCFFENLGDINSVQDEDSVYRNISLHEMLKTAAKKIKPGAAAVLYYHPKKTS